MRTMIFIVVMSLAANWPLIAAAAEPARQPARLEQAKSQSAKDQNAKAQPPRELTLKLAKGIKIKLMLIPAGTFLMGTPEKERISLDNQGPQHEVKITRPFYLGVYEVTQAQYQGVTGHNPSRFKGPLNPVDSVSWDDAMNFCKKASHASGRMVGLPTEAQWEYACRAGTKTRYSFGDDAAELFKYGNYCDKSCTFAFPWKDKEHSDGFDRTAPVGSFKPNPWGLYDMHGNLWEWCSDRYAKNYGGGKNVDPAGPDHSKGDARVLRGGCWKYFPQACQSDYRFWSEPGHRNNYNGFRVCVQPE